MTMHKGVWLSFVAAAGLLAGCGGGGSDSQPQLTPPPPQPAPQPEPDPEPQPEPPAEPETIHDLQKDHSFTASAASNTFAIRADTGEASSTHASSGSLTVSYDAQSKSYTVASNARSYTFAPADLNTESTENLAIYQKDHGTSNEQLILLKTSLDETSATKHVAMGLLQVNSFSSGGADSTIDAFVYGFESPVSAIPRSGTGSFSIDVIGTAVSTDTVPRTFDGSGHFDVDFDHGIFSTHTALIERDIFTGVTDSGTGFELNGTGKLSSTDGTFSGRITYSGIAGTLPGTLDGRFYGPDASELGATFTASDGTGSTVAGAMTGWRASDTPSVNLTLTDLVRPEIFLTDEAYRDPDTGEPLGGNGRLILEPDGRVEFSPDNPAFGLTSLSSDTIVASTDPNFTVYETDNVLGANARIELYKPGQANTELQLTYVSFGQWQRAPEGTPLGDGDRVFFTYGLRTPEGALSARTGSAHYEGVAYGMALNIDTQARYDVNGTSRFDVDFSKQTLSGDLALAGKSAGGATPVDGTYQFGGSIDHMNRVTPILFKDGTDVGTLQAGFYGPNGEEIAGSFAFAVRDKVTDELTTVTGATVARQK